jgi:hypothetical protein
MPSLGLTWPSIEAEADLRLIGYTKDKAVGNYFLP